MGLTRNIFSFSNKKKKKPGKWFWSFTSRCTQKIRYWFNGVQPCSLHLEYVDRTTFTLKICGNGYKKKKKSVKPIGPKHILSWGMNVFTGVFVFFFLHFIYYYYPKQSPFHASNTLKNSQNCAGEKITDFNNAWQCHLCSWPKIIRDFLLSFVTFIQNKNRAAYGSALIRIK